MNTLFSYFKKKGGEEGAPKKVCNSLASENDSIVVVFVIVPFSPEGDV